LTDPSYDEGKQPESVSVVLGHEIGKEAIRLLIATGGREQRKGLRLSPRKRSSIRFRI
jgi:hypothetical protein